MARQKSGPGVWPAARKLFSVLTLFTYYLFFIGVHELALLGLGYFCIKTKVKSPRGYERRVYRLKEEVKVKIPPI
jgi:hypothetical protein